MMLYLLGGTETVLQVSFKQLKKCMGKILFLLIALMNTVTCRVYISCSKLALEKSQTVRQAISGYISEALGSSPSIVIFDDLDNVISFSSDDEGYQPSSSATALVNLFINILDEYGVCFGH